MCLNDGADMIGALRPEGRLSRKISLNAARLVKLRSHDRLLFSNGEGTLLYSEGSLRFAVDDTLTASFQISNLLHFKYKIGSKFVYRDGIDLKDKEFDLNRKETTLHFEGHPQLIFCIGMRKTTLARSMRRFFIKFVHCLCQCEDFVC